MNQHQKKIWAAKVGDPISKLVLLKLADYANHENVCWPSVDHIAEQCELSRSSVFRKLLELEKAGFIERTFRPNHSNVYKVGVNLRPSQIDTVGNRVSVTPRGSHIATLAVSDCDVQGSQVATQIHKHRSTTDPPLIPHRKKNAKKDAPKQLVRDFRKRFQHYPKKSVPELTRKELAAATALLASASANEIMDLADKAMHDKWAPTRQAAGSLQALLKNLGELRARFSVAPLAGREPDAEHCKRIVGWKTPEELEVQWQEYLQFCKAKGQKPDPAMDPKIIMADPTYPQELKHA